MRTLTKAAFFKFGIGKLYPLSLQGKKPRVSGFPLGVLSRLLTVLRLLYASDGCDYRLAIQRWWRSRAPVQAKGRRRGRRCGSLHTAESKHAYTTKADLLHSSLTWKEAV